MYRALGGAERRHLFGRQRGYCAAAIRYDVRAHNTRPHIDEGNNMVDAGAARHDARVVRRADRYDSMPVCVAAQRNVWAESYYGPGRSKSQPDSVGAARRCADGVSCPEHTRKHRNAPMHALYDYARFACIATDTVIITVKPLAVNPSGGPLVPRHPSTAVAHAPAGQRGDTAASLPLSGCADLACRSGRATQPGGRQGRRRACWSRS